MQMVEFHPPPPPIFVLALVISETSFDTRLFPLLMLSALHFSENLLKVFTSSSAPYLWLRLLYFFRYLLLWLEAEIAVKLPVLLPLPGSLFNCAKQLRPHKKPPSREIYLNMNV